MAYCGPCDRDFVSGEALIQHWENSSRHGYYCLRCVKPFNSFSALNQHLHDSPKHNLCSECPKSLDFTSSDELDSHRETVHHYCTSCDFSFNTPEQLQDHDVSEHNMCTICRNYFGSPSNLKAHLITHQPKTKECFGCDRMFSSWSAMLLHMEYGGCPSEMDEDEMIGLALECYQSSHYECQDGENNFECPTCGSPFLQMSGLVQHAESDACQESLSHGRPLSKFLRFLRMRMA
ncbi:hypothetical protein J3F84DRAFT_77455 [Trichoderma pleuroticola]